MPAAERAVFARLRALLEELNASGHKLDTLSMGMSGGLRVRHRRRGDAGADRHGAFRASRCRRAQERTLEKDGMNNIRRLAFIGGGNMAAALIGGLTKRGLPAARVVVADPSQDQLKRLVRDFGVTTAADNATAVKGAEVVVLAVKPQQMRAVALGLAPHLAGTLPLVISVAAGIPHAALARWFGPAVPVIRTMPNRPAL